MKTVGALARPAHILRLVMAAAIRERRVLSLTYVGAAEPQLFAPLALYVNAANRLMVDGYELNGKRVRWRELELDAVRDVRQSEHTYSFDARLAPTWKTYPQSTAVIERAKLPNPPTIVEIDVGQRRR